MNIKAGDVVVHKLGERLLVLEVTMQPVRYLKCRRSNFDIVTIKDREIAGLELNYLLAVPEAWTPDRIRKVQQCLNDYLSGSPAGLNEMKLVPGGARVRAPIYRFLDRLGAIWQRFPQLRLGQLIRNVFNYPSDEYYIGERLLVIEDEAFISALEEFYGKEGGVQ